MNVFFILSKLFLSSFILLNLYANNCLIESLVILPFNFISKKTIESFSKMSAAEYYEYYLNGALYTTIDINNKPIKFHLTLDRHTSYISEKTLSEIDPESATIQKNEDLYSLEYIGIYRAKYANSSFSFLSNATQNISLNNYSFFMVRKFTDNFESEKKTKSFALEDEEIGLNVLKGNRREYVKVEEEEIDPYDFGDDEETEGEKYVYKNNGYLIEEKTNIIYQLKKSDNIPSYSFMIKFDDEKRDKGTITIGSKPHEFDPRHYSEKFYIYQYTNMYTNEGSAYGYWGIVFKDIQYNGEIFDSIKAVDITIDFCFILANERFKEYLDIKFFKYSTISEYCYEETIDKIYIIKYCNKSVIKKFKNISFGFSSQLNSYNQTCNMEFDYKDLFVKAPGGNDNYYFQIIFQKDYYNSWKLGLPIFKKYPIVFDQESKTFGFYSETGQYSTDNKGGKNKKKTKLTFSWILVIILSVCLIGLGFAFFKMLPKIMRKKKANELDDDYEYTSANNINS